MAKTDSMYMRVEPDLKANAEEILSQLGITPNEAINIFLKQVVIHKGLPFEVKIPPMTKSEARAILMSKIKEAEDSLANEPPLSLEESRRLLGL
jgi:addiction module RelB/DinJ family antitoxin